MSDSIVLTSTGTQADIDAALASRKTAAPVAPATPETPAPTETAAAPLAAPETPPAGQTPPAEAKAPETTPKVEAAKPDPAAVKPDTIEKMQERINRITHARYSTEQQLEAAQAEIRALQGKIQALASVQPPPADPASTYVPKPKPTEAEIGTTYKDYTEFVEALSKWSAEDATSRLRHEQAVQDKANRETQQAQQAQQAEQETLQAFQGRAVEFAKGTPDYNTTVAVLGSPDLPVHPVAMVHILESEMGPELAYYLAQHPDELKAINAIPKGGKVVAALGRLEERLETAKKKAPKSDPPPPPPEPPKTPEPIEPVGTTSVTSEVKPDAMGTNFAQWKRDRNEDIRRRGARV